MTSSVSHRATARGCAAAALFVAAMTVPAAAADMPETILRGGYSEPAPEAYARWDGISLGAQFGWSNLSADFGSVSSTTTLPKVSTNGGQFGGFIGYNAQWERLVLGVEGAYNRFNSLTATATNDPVSSTFRIVDYATLRGRAGYAYGQFLPYMFVGAAAARVNYQTTTSGAITSSRDNAFAGGFTAGLGIDVAILPNVFLRAEYEYVMYTQIDGIRSSTNTARAGVGIRF
ncbi:MAG TPA: outer membrane beta-barrel protein [Pseudolabrys sp.]|jgi:outer membrane immunogenic protein|nr:outer membrane beta-barrel protein [Pseudolabrys sp.]